VREERRWYRQIWRCCRGSSSSRCHRSTCRTYRRRCLGRQNQVLSVRGACPAGAVWSECARLWWPSHPPQSSRKQGTVTSGYDLFLA